MRSIFVSISRRGTRTASVSAFFMLYDCVEEAAAAAAVAEEDEGSRMFTDNSASLSIEYFNKFASCCSLISTSADFFFKIDGASRSRTFNVLCSCFLLIGLRDVEVAVELDVAVDVELEVS